jgi:hypothetical protein
LSSSSPQIASTFFSKPEGRLFQPRPYFAVQLLLEILDFLFQLADIAIMPAGLFLSELLAPFLQVMGVNSFLPTPGPELLLSELGRFEQDVEPLYAGPIVRGLFMLGHDGYSCFLGSPGQRCKVDRPTPICAATSLMRWFSGKVFLIAVSRV